MKNMCIFNIVSANVAQCYRAAHQYRHYGLETFFPFCCLLVRVLSIQLTGFYSSSINHNKSNDPTLLDTLSFPAVSFGNFNEKDFVSRLYLILNALEKSNSRNTHRQTLTGISDVSCDALHVRCDISNSRNLLRADLA